MLPYIKEAYRRGYAVLVMNPNERLDCLTRERAPFSTMESHCLHVWEKVVLRYSPSKKIDVIAHSMGGYCTVRILSKFGAERVNRIGFTDSVHGSSFMSLFPKEKAALYNKAINFVCDSQKAGKVVKKGIFSGGCLNLSCGHLVHAYSSGYAIKEVFKHLESDSYREKKIKLIK